MSNTRRNFLKAAGALTSLGLFGLGYKGTLKGIASGWWNGQQPADKIYGNALQPEWRVDRVTGEVTPNPDQYVANSVCVGCVSLCGVRVRVDKKRGKVLRVAGNPYHALASDPHLPYTTSIKDSFKALSRFQESGLKGRATACGRGNAVLAKLDDPHRVLVPLKRVGPRNSGKWEPIDFETLVKEVVEGGNLFGEGEVEGLRSIRDLETPIDPAQPELGPKANQFAIVGGFKEGRLPLLARFGKTSFGSINFTGHRGNCGLSMRAGYAAFLGDWKKYPHLKPDFKNARYILNIGTAPANAGNPFMRQGRLVAEGRASGRLKVVVVDPVLTNSDSKAAGDRTEWIPVKPGTDGALVMAMIRWIFDSRRYNKKFLEVPGPAAAKKAGEPSWSNGCHLVVVEEGHPLFGAMLRGSHLGLPVGKNDKDPFMVIDAGTGELRPHTQAMAGELFYQGKVSISGQDVQVKSSLQLLREEAEKMSLAEYSKECGVSESTIVKLASEFTRYGRQAVADCHGGTMHTNGFYTAYAVTMLNGLVGNLNWKGGASAGGGRYPDFGRGPRYNFKKFPGKVKPKGVPVSRKFAYEKTSEFKRKKAAGKPYPADGPWYPFSAAIQSEYIPSALNGYPYPLKALLLWNTNPLYGQAGLYTQAKKQLADPKKLPLIISIDPFINETTAFADYIVPDTVLYETWGSAWPWASHLTKINSFRWPVVEPPVAKTAEQVPICMESFIIAVAKRMGLPGFGDRAIPDAEGNIHPLNTPDDFFLRVFANVAFAGKPVPDSEQEDLTLTGVDRHLPRLKAVLKAEEWPKVAYAMARGGRFQSISKAYEGQWLARRYSKPVQIYNEQAGRARNSLSGEYYSGVPTWQPPVLADGTPFEKVYDRRSWPFQVVCTKSQLQSSHTIGEARLTQIHPSNGIIMHPEDADRLKIKTGDRIRVTSPAGSVEGVADVRNGIQQGVLGIEHGFGHWALGAASVTIGSKRQPGDPALGAGVAHNLLGLDDPTRRGISTLADVVIGSNARQSIVARVERI
ncbi:tetrathionate reductase subunit A [Desulfolithobacter dissulfuricans]|uniref:Tetrathionate reductase subunit A n=1 Tax=Desulfolithobacter dissulfuricans TaxID=2795293 RepID=A0A915TZ91_9BACT|nr:molybdopterin dinucleotide binding domain-containing protein [Desulfolithobacter dissulfuricans]BCO08019.1 tetrathionate reductase subunit A [Desulfolithobacter dissulfuricans]